GNPDASTLQIVSGPSHGTAVDPPNTITYTPNKGYIGTDSLTYRVCSTDNPLLCTQAVLSFSVTAEVPSTGLGGKVINSGPNSWILATEILGLLGLGFGLRRTFDNKKN
ncbi:MAG: Ig-like domain-containing protein, partial [Candidatus Saccharibacteria bacterium]